MHVIKSILTFQSKCCPYCASDETVRFGSNSPLSHIRRCNKCFLIYRWPKQDTSFNRTFYQKAYSKLHRSTATDLPNPSDIENNLMSVLREGNRDFSHYIHLMKELNLHSVLDYGCSWGYGTYQFQEAGMNAYGYEISTPRMEFGTKNLNVRLFDNLKTIKSEISEFDVVFCSHVIEHFPDPRLALDDFSMLVKNNGWLMIAVPNCGGILATELKEKWGPFSSSIHPLSYTAGFFQNALPQHGFNSFSFFSEPYVVQDMIRNLSSHAACPSPRGEELLIIARKSG